MKLFTPLSFITLAVSSIYAKVDYTGHKVYRVQVSNKSELSQLNFFSSANKIDNLNALKIGKVDLLLNPQQAIAFSKDVKLNYKVLNDNIQALINSGMKSSRSGGFIDSYHSVAEINSWIYQIAANSKGAAKVHNIGTSFEGRSINAITFRAPGSKPKKSIVYHGGIHAREWISPATVIALIDSFSRYKSDLELLRLLDTFEYSFIPVSNPDGYEFSRVDDRFWRKNRQPNIGNECIGTDTNRNWDYQWKVGQEVCSEDYPGPEPFSSPEAKAIKRFLTSKKNIIHYIDFHSYGQLFMQPYGYTCDSNPKDFEAIDIAAKLAISSIQQATNRTYTQGSICKVIYKAYGNTVDWAYETGKIKYPYTVELPDTGDNTFFLPESEIASVGKEILAAVKSIGKYIKEVETL